VIAHAHQICPRGVISGGAVERDITRHEVLGVLPGAAADKIKREYDAKIIAGKISRKGKIRGAYVR
jgi:hypothetical protein